VAMGVNMDELELLIVVAALSFLIIWALV
jgi:hypothetical protein